MDDTNQSKISALEDTEFELDLATKELLQQTGGEIWAHLVHLGRCFMKISEVLSPKQFKRFISETGLSDEDAFHAMQMARTALQVILETDTQEER